MGQRSTPSSTQVSRKLKPSGIRWLGDVPAEWEVKRAKYYLREIDHRSKIGNEELLSVSHLTGVTPRSEKNVTMFEAETYEGSKLCWPGDLVINTMWAWMSALGVSSRHGIVSPSYAVYRLSRPELFEPYYLDFLLRIPAYGAEYRCRSTGIRESRMRLYPDEFLKIPVLRPPLEVQRSILAFLDRKLEQVDRYLTTKRRQLGCLAELRGVRSEAVLWEGRRTTTRVPTDIQWLPSMPMHWKTIRLHQAASSLQTGPFGSQLHAADYVDGGIPVINPSQMRRGRIVPESSCSVTSETAARLAIHQVQAADILFARRGEMGRCALVTECEKGWLCGTGSLRLRPRPGLFDPHYLLFVLSTRGVAEVLKLHSVGTVMDNLNEATLHRIVIPVPPISEQKEMAKHIVRSTSEIEAAATAIEREIDLMTEYRSALIAAVLTGRFDGRQTD